MQLLQLVFCALLVLLVSAQERYPGPQRTEMEDGKEVWKTKIQGFSDTLTYRVNDLQSRGARPKMVYNCAVVPALCNNARAKLNGGSTATFHYDSDDRNSNRKNARRDTSCPGNWKDSHTCPESNQPREFWFTKPGKTTLEKKAVEMWRGKRGQDPPDRAQFAELVKIEYDNGIGTETWRRLGAQLSCDEWPAASWIEGGAGANTYCAPIFAKCETVYLRTEQNFQAGIHRQIGNWYNNFYAQWPENTTWTDNAEIIHNLNWAIFKVDFELVNDGGHKYAAWLESKGRKRYCVPAVGDDDCKVEWDEDPDGFFDQLP